MKKILVLMALVFSMSLGAMAKDTYSHDPSILPQPALTTVKNNFKSDISVIKIDKDFGRISDYEVILTDGTEIKFDRNGNWEDVECANNKSIPSAFVPEMAATFIKKNQPGVKVVGIEKSRGGYEIQLSNGIEMKFDKRGQFQRYD
ncbi:MAG: PepSY-like domain-containing protein [Muribaculum sp.]|nr:PepSY-like domain-containing protein [Muribaculum sp.]